MVDDSETLNNGWVVRLESCLSCECWSVPGRVSYHVREPFGSAQGPNPKRFVSFSSINGMLEMQGFQGTFSELFEQSKECYEDPVTGMMLAA